MNNGFGSTIYFGDCAASVNIVTGSILSFKLKNEASVKEYTDCSDNFMAIAISKRKKVANVEVLLTGSGSAIQTANIGDTATITCPWTANVAGNWAVTAADTELKADDAAKQTLELTQWLSSTGTVIN